MYSLKSDGTVDNSSKLKVSESYRMTERKDRDYANVEVCCKCGRKVCNCRTNNIARRNVKRYNRNIKFNLFHLLIVLAIIALLYLFVIKPLFFRTNSETTSQNNATTKSPPVVENK